MQIPEAITQFFPEGKKLLEEKKLGEFHFSRGTYQVEIKDGRSYWPFCQFDDKGGYLDAFCSCEHSTKNRGCPHIAAAFLKIFSGHREPLHVRFHRSFWFYLFEEASRNIGYDVGNLIQEKEAYVAFSEKEKKSFYLLGSSFENKKKLKEIFSERKIETEETSLKFVNLSKEELLLYKRGRASSFLRFELSFWSDLAKWFFLQQEEEKSYEIVFPPSENIPQKVQVQFPELFLEVFLENLLTPPVIESLSTVNASLKIREKKEEFPPIVFLPEVPCFVIQKQREKKALEGGIEIGDWVYLAHRGFYRKIVHPLLREETIQEGKIAEALSFYPSLFQRYLNVSVNTSLHKLCYELFFDERQAFHIKAYLSEEKDLKWEKALFFPPWIYLPQKGFFQVQMPHFPSLHTIVKREEVSEFITKNRIFLEAYPGFQTHIHLLQTFVHYRIDAEKNLEFFHSLGEIKGKILDFGKWVFLPNKGFFQKEGKEFSFTLLEKKIKAGEIASFLEQKKEELFWIDGFFSEKSPVKRVGIALFFTEDKKIQVKPQVAYEEGYSPEKVIWFSHYTYVEGEGFFDISEKGKLPSQYAQKKEIAPKEETFFMQYEMEKLRPFLVHIDPELKSPQKFQLKLESLYVKKRKKKTFLLADIKVSTEIGEISLLEVWQALQQKKKMLFSKAGLLYLDQTRFQWVKNWGKKKVYPKEKLVKLSFIEWIRLSILEQIDPPLEDTEEARKTRNLLEKLFQMDTKRLLDISRLSSSLRPYQEIGLQWLWHLYCHGLAGILCDDMGLGKTHQAMALLAASFQEEPSHKYLIVCPTSVIYHWQDLLQRYLPSLRVLVYHGINRSLSGFPKDYDVLVTSYGILRTGKENFKGYPFEIAILDEIQFAKNVKSQTHQNLIHIEASMKLGLTGTPVENRIKELKALFDIVLPNYLPSPSVFREFFEIPIEKNRDLEKRKLLAKLIKPFTLRRKKEEVLLDLPEKIEQIVFCDLSEEQKKLYEELVEKRREHILQLLQGQSHQVPIVPIFSFLSQVKQLCDHPSVLLKTAKEYEKHTSGKWEVFEELIEEALDSDQKVVIFSQYLDMIEIFKKFFRKKRVNFSCLTGSTKDRKAEMQKFHQDPSCKIFLASLLAAGVGIDLSCASVVIHYDRWWNAAKEDQATDRVHRIGQRRGVQVFKLVTKGTIEEAISALIHKKKFLLESTVGKDDMDQIRLLTREELITLFQRKSL